MKRIINLIALFIASSIFIVNANAATGSISASSSTNQAVVGSTFTVTVKVSCSEALGSWQFGITYDSANISLQSGDTSVAAYGDGSTKVKTYTYRFKAIKSGKANVRITGASMVSWNDVNTLFNPSTSNTSITVKTQAEIEASYSKDNNLKSLTVSDYKLTPDFDKNITEYTLEVPDDVTSINVSAKVNDANARVSGTGSINVSEGSNKIDVLVTAQNGSTKTYTINVTVKDLTPIEVVLNNKNYTVIKKAELLECPTGFTPTIIKINDIEIPAFTSSITKFTLVGLKSDEGSISLYIYNADKNSYTLYTEVKSNTLTLYPVKGKNDLETFEKTSVTINGVEFDAYKNTISEDFVLIYALNVEDGNEGFYIYDSGENNFLKYKNDIIEILKNQNSEYKLYILTLGCVLVIFLLISIILSTKNKKLKKLILKVSNKMQNQDDNEKITQKDENIEDKNTKKKKNKSSDNSNTTTDINEN